MLVLKIKTEEISNVMKSERKLKMNKSFSKNMYNIINSQINKII